MRPIFASEDKDEYALAWERLTAAGIPVFEPAKHADLSGFRVGPRQRVLCIWLDRQYDDAVALLRDPDHVVKDPVDPDEFARVQDQVDDSLQRATDRLTEKVLNWIVSLVALAILGGIAYVATR